MAAEKEESHEVDNVEEKDDLNKPIYTLEVLSIIKESQLQHGLRHGDYQRYRSYCTRRLRRIRKCVNLVQGTRNRYIPKPVNKDNVVDVRCLYIPLVEAERCWSYAMQLKAEANRDPRKQFHMINKLRRAVHYTQELAELSDQVAVDARTKLEVQAYSEWMSGLVEFELKRWQSAMELLTKAKVIYEKLASALVGDAVLTYNQKVADIEPSVRYCAYNIGDTEAANDLRGIRLAMGGTDSVLDDLIQKTREVQASSLHEVTWRDRTLPIKSDKVRVFLLTEQESVEEVKAAADIDTKIEVYDRVIKDCVEALQSLKEELKSDETFRKYQRGQQIEGRVPSQVLLHTYLQYIKINKTIMRNLLMVDMYKQSLGKPPAEGQKMIRPQDIGRLYEIIIQNRSDILSLPGIQDDAELEEEIQADIVANKAFRCYYMALSYSYNKQWPEVVALSKRSQQYVDQAKQVVASDKKQTLDGLEQTLKDIDSLLIKAQASSILDSASTDLSQDMSKLSITDDKRPIAERLDDYFPGSAKISTKKIILVKSPPDMQPIACKPLFFDLAYNHIQMPDVSHKIAKEEKKAGITGFMKSWIGGWTGKK